MEARRTVDAPELRMAACLLVALDDDLDRGVALGEASDLARAEEGAHAAVGALLLRVREDELLAGEDEGGRRRGGSRGQRGGE